MARPLRHRDPRRAISCRRLCGKEPVPSGKPASGDTLHVELDHFPQFLPNGRAWFESRQERWIHFQRLAEEGQTSWRDDGAGYRLSTRARGAESSSPSRRKEPGASALKRPATRAPIEVRQIPREAEDFHLVQGGRMAWVAAFPYRTASPSAVIAPARLASRAAAEIVSRESRSV